MGKQSHQTRGDQVIVRNSRIAIIGDGVGALITFAVLCHAGVPATEITIYGDSPHPLATLQRYAQAVEQTVMRSESNGHLAPVDFPGLALVEAWQRRSLWPLLASLFDRYTPPLGLLLSQGAALTTQLGIQERKVSARVTSLIRCEPPEPAFALMSNRERVGVAQHVILALGHAGLAWPEAALAWRTDARVKHAYQAPSFQRNEHIVVVGGGMAAVHVWLAALKAGANVTVLHRHPLRRQRLNAPRCAFSAAGIDTYQRLKPRQRERHLKAIGAGSFPWRLRWEWALWQASRKGRFATRQAELVELEASNSTSAPSDQETTLILHLNDSTTLRADKLICATGLQSNALAYPLMRQLANNYNVPIANGHLLLKDDFILSPLSQSGSICGVVGALARWALPVADTFTGIKYAARRIAPRFLGS